MSSKPAKKQPRPAKKARVVKAVKAWAVQIGARPHHQPYLMIRGDGHFTPDLFDSPSDAERARLSVPEPDGAWVVPVSIVWTPRKKKGVCK